MTVLGYFFGPILINSGDVLGAKGPLLKISGGTEAAEDIKYGDLFENHQKTPAFIGSFQHTRN